MKFCLCNVILTAWVFKKAFVCLFPILIDYCLSPILDGLYAHLYLFSPRTIMKGCLSMAESSDFFQQPMIEILTEEKAQYVVASILVNCTLIKEFYTGRHTARMLASLVQQYVYWRKCFSPSWSEMFTKVNKNAFNRFFTAQLILPRDVYGGQCSFTQAKSTGLC